MSAKLKTAWADLGVVLVVNGILGGCRRQSWARRHNRHVTYVHLLLPQVDDTDDDLQRLVRWFGGRPARVNLMRRNPVEGGDSFERIGDRELSRFRQRLCEARVPAVVRDTQGRDIGAACGQLWLRRQIADGIGA